MIEILSLFAIGFFILIKGADFLIDGATSIAKRLNISSWIIGITIVGVGTSIPEFSITFLEALKGEARIGLGAILGSNTFNILFILGLSAMVMPIQAKPHWVKKELAVNIYAILIAAVLAIFPVGGGGFFEITRSEGFVLLFLFLAWIFYLVYRNGKTKEHESEKGPSPVVDFSDTQSAKPEATEKFTTGPSLRIFALPLSLLMIIAGLAGVVVGARWVVEGGQFLAGALGISQAIVGLTIVGIGTSLPELTVSVSAARKGNVGISLGNIIGSNVFDFFGILGITAIASNVSFPRELVGDFMVTLGAATILLIMMLWGKPKFSVSRGQGFMLMALYVLYLATIGKI